VNYTLRVRNDGNFPEDIRTRLLIPDGYNYTITPHRFRLPRDSSKYMGLVVEAPGDDLPFLNYTLQFYAVGGSIPLDEIVLPGFPVSNIDMIHGDEGYTFTAASAYEGSAEFLWEVNHGMYPLPPEDETSPEFTMNFEEAGSYTVTLTTTITDEMLRDLTDTSSVTIIIGNQGPNLSGIPGEFSLEVNETLVLDSSVVIDPDSTIVDVMFIHNGTTVHATKLVVSFQKEGSYTITMRVVDNLGLVTEKQITIVVSSPRAADEKGDQHLLTHTGTSSLLVIAIVLFLVLGLLMMKRREVEDAETDALSRLEEMRDLKDKQGTMPKESGASEETWKPKEKPGKPAISEKPEQPEKPEKQEKSEWSEKPEKSEKPGDGKPEEITTDDERPEEKTGGEEKKDEGGSGPATETKDDVVAGVEERREV